MRTPKKDAGGDDQLFFCFFWPYKKYPNPLNRETYWQQWYTHNPSNPSSGEDVHLKFPSWK